MKHTLSILVENKFGVLARVAGLFSARGYNIDSLAVSETEDPTVSRMTVVVNAEDEQILEQIEKQLHKLIDIITVVDFRKNEYIERELVFVKIALDEKRADEIKKAAREIKADILEETKDYLILELVDNQEQIRKSLKELENYKILELVRSGRIAIAK